MTQDPFKIAITPFVNDTYLFSGFIVKKPVLSFDWDLSFFDLEELNQIALRGDADVVKVSLATYSLISQDYVLLPIGNTIVHKSGPVLVSREPLSHTDMSQQVLAIPGKLTTAFLLTKLLPKFREIREYPYDQMIPKLLSHSDDVSCALLIHEGSLLSEKYGLHLVADLFSLWYERFKLPLPLGGIAMKRSLGMKVIQEFTQALRASCEFAENPEHKAVLWDVLQSYAPQLSLDVIAQSLTQWVNGETKELTPKGIRSIMSLMGLAQGELVGSHEDLIAPW